MIAPLTKVSTTYEKELRFGSLRVMSMTAGISGVAVEGLC